MEGIDRRQGVHRQLAVVRSRLRPAVPVPGQGGHDADGHVHRGGFSAEHQVGNGLLPVPDHRHEGADGRRRPGRVAAHSRRRRRTRPTRTRSSRSWKRRRSARNSRRGSDRCRRTASRRTGRSDLEDRLPDPVEHEGRHRAVLRSRHDEGNGRRRHEGHAAIRRRSDEARFDLRATRSRRASGSTRSEWRRRASAWRCAGYALAGRGMHDRCSHLSTIALRSVGGRRIMPTPSAGARSSRSRDARASSGRAASVPRAGLRDGRHLRRFGRSCRRIVLSFYDWDGMSEQTFVGLANYIELFHAPTFYTASKNNVIWLVLFLLAPPIGLRSPCT